MRYYPVNLNLNKKNCLVIGGGKVAFRKVKVLLSYGALVKLVSPEIFTGIKKIKDKDFRYQKRRYSGKDLKNVFLAVIATDDMVLNTKISKEAKKRKILVNVVDVPALCDFILPAIAERKNLTITVSTNGISPALAKYLRKDIEKKYDGYATLLEVLKFLRSRIIKLDKKRKNGIWKSIINKGFLDKMKDAGRKQINKAIIKKINI